MSLKTLTIVVLGIIAVAVTIALIQGVLSEGNYMAIMTLIVTSLVGIIRGGELMSSRRSFRDDKRKRMIIDSALFGLGVGVALMVSKAVTGEAIITWPPILDHGLYGWLLATISTVILTKWHGKYWWDK